MKKKPDLETIETALDRVLTELIEFDVFIERQPLQLTRQYHNLQEPLPERLLNDVQALAKNPMPAALEQAVRTLGKALYAEVGTIEDMRMAAERVCAFDEPYFQKRFAIVEVAWSGIGSGDDRWWR